jgi:hypothetical protein
VTARLSDIENKVAAYDAALKPITGQPVGHLEPQEMVEYFRNRKPLAEAGIETDAVALLRTMLDVYEHGPETTREAIRGMFSRYRSFCSTVTLPWEPTAESFRLHVVLWSARDLAPDGRDELLTMQAWCDKAKAAGIDVAPIAREIAAISSDTERWAMGSTRSLLRRLGGLDGTGSERDR